MNSRECAFCDAQNFSERLISENELACAFLSSPRLEKGHSLVIPRRHVTVPSELTSQEIVAMHELIAPLHKKLGEIAAGVDVWQKSRPHVGEDGIKMNHLHTHIIPSNPGDPRYDRVLQWGRVMFSTLYRSELDEMIGLLKG